MRSVEDRPGTDIDLKTPDQARSTVSNPKQSGPKHLGFIIDVEHYREFLHTQTLELMTLHFPNCVKRGPQLHLGDRTGAAPTKRGSLVIELAGPKAGTWYDHATGQGGVIDELIADKLPNTPARTEALGLSARIVLGGACGMAIAISAGIGLAFSVLLASIGALAGTFAGYNARHFLVSKAHVPDFAVAVAEDMITIAGGLLILWYAGW